MKNRKTRASVSARTTVGELAPVAAAEDPNHDPDPMHDEEEEEESSTTTPPPASADPPADEEEEKEEEEEGAEAMASVAPSSDAFAQGLAAIATLPADSPIRVAFESLRSSEIDGRVNALVDSAVASMTIAPRVAQAWRQEFRAALLAGDSQREKNLRLMLAAKSAPQGRLPAAAEIPVPGIAGQIIGTDESAIVRRRLADRGISKKSKGWLAEYKKELQALRSESAGELRVS